MSEGKEGIITQIKKKIGSAVEESIAKIDAKTVVDIAAVGSFAAGGLLIGIGISYDTAVAGFGGAGFAILGLARLIHNSGGFR